MQTIGMKLLLVVLCAAAAVAAEVPQLFYHESIGVPEATRIKLAEENAVDGERIVGGSAAALGAYPYMGGLVITLTTGATSVCGSTLLSNTRLLTAAHCWWDGRNLGWQLTVVLGSTRLFTGGVRLDTTDVEMHASWQPNTLSNNLAVITIPNVHFNSVIQPVNLPTDVQMEGNNFASRWAVAIGFGRTSDFDGIAPYQYLSRVNLQIITNEVCQQSLGNALVFAGRLCTSGLGGVGPCGGDSGGPLVIITPTNQHVLVGMTAYGLWGCELAMPSVFMRITSFENWIRARI